MTSDMTDAELNAVMIELPHGLPARWGVRVRDHIAALTADNQSLRASLETTVRDQRDDIAAIRERLQIVRTVDYLTRDGEPTVDGWYERDVSRLLAHIDSLTAKRDRLLSTLVK